MGTAAPPALPYDRLVSRLGTMFFDDPPVAFANLRRWLVPGGQFAFAVWGPLADNAWITTIREAVAEAVDLPPVDLAAPGPFRNDALPVARRALTGRFAACEQDGRVAMGARVHIVTGTARER